MISFALEWYLQRLVEHNMKAIFEMDFVASEFNAIRIA
jgi:hypothetical protein